MTIGKKFPLKEMALLMALFFSSSTGSRAETKGGKAAESLSICYNIDIPSARFEPFNLVVVDSAYPVKDVGLLREKGKTVFGYLSLGAVGKYRWWFEPLSRAGALRGQNPGFDSQVIDLANPLWAKLIEERIIPEMAEKGFNGIFLDDLDLIYQTDQQRLGVELIAKIRNKFPGLKLMGNRGLEYLGDFAKDLDYVLLESCAAYRGKLTSGADLEWALRHLALGKKANRHLIACALDYYAEKPVEVTPPLQELIAAIRQRHSANGLLSCVSVESLDIVPTKP